MGNLEQLTGMYHRLVSQNSGLKVECSVLEKKLGRKEQRIIMLEKAQAEAKTKYQKLLHQCANLSAAMDLVGGGGGSSEKKEHQHQHQQHQHQQEVNTPPKRHTNTNNLSNNIVRPILGGSMVVNDGVGSTT